MDFIVEWTEKAQKDRENIYSYWNNRNQSNSFSKKLESLIQRHIQRAKLFPNIGFSTNRFNVRYFIILNDFKLFYKIHGNKIIIMHFWDVRQRPDKFSV